MLPPTGRESTTAIPTWVERLWSTPWLWMAIVITFFCVPLFVGLGRTDFDNDEAIYSFGVDVMLKDGDWLTPKSIPDETSPFLEKPPLKFWLVALPVSLGWLPANEFGYRFMDALLASVAFLYVLAIGRRLGSPVTGLVAVLLLFTMQGLLFYHGIRTNNMESSLLLAYCGGIYHFLAWRSVNPDAKRHIYGMSLWFVFGFMTKFVAVLFLPVVLILAALLTRVDRVRTYRDWKTFVMAAGLAAGLIAPWFVYQYFKHGQYLIDTMFGEHVMKRFTAYLDPSHLHPWNYYLEEIWADVTRAGTRLWIGLGALLLVAKTVRHRWTPGAAVVLWFVLPIAAISTTTSKLYHYGYPFIPPVALAGGFLASYVAKFLFRALQYPFDRFDQARLHAWGRWFSAPRIQMAATAVGVLASGIGLATYVFDRLRLSIGSIQIRNSHVWRPFVFGLVVIVVAAPASVLRALTAGVIPFGLLPVQAYHQNVMRMQATTTPYGDVRSCLARVVADEVARGGKPPGVWIEAKSLSHLPVYYFRGLGPVQRRDVFSDATDVMHLLVPAVYRPLLLSNERYGELMTKLMTERDFLVGRAAKLIGADPAVLHANLDSSVIGVTSLQNATLVLPGPYAVCGMERALLRSQ